MDIYNASSALTPNAFKAFSKPPRQQVLRPGEELFRFGTILSPAFEGNDVFGSPWWIPRSTYQQISKTAHRTGKSMIEVARSRLAVATPWNPKMDWLMIVELRKPVQAWLGPARAQPLDGRDRSVLLLGQFDQAYVPGLAAPGATTSEAAVLTYYGSPDF